MTDDGLDPRQAAELEALLDEAHGRGDEGDFQGMAERELGLDGIAYERFKQCLAADPEDPFVLATAGTALASFDDPEAETALRAAALLAPDVPLARWMYGAYLTREGQVEQGQVEQELSRAEQEWLELSERLEAAQPDS